MFGITVEDPSTQPGETKAPLHVWQNSWGLSTRTIGIMVMVHGDNRGLVIPPRVADIQVVIVPVGLTVKTTDEKRAALMAEIDGIAIVLEAAGVRVEVDKREGYSPGWKFNDWELRGTPLRLEFGPGESEGHYVTTSRRDIAGKEGKGTIQIADLGTQVPALLDRIQADLYARADAEFRSHVKLITNWEDFCPSLNAKNLCMIPHCLTEECEDGIKDLSARKAEEETGEPQDAKAPSMGAKSLCIPFDQPEGIEPGVTKCTNPECTRFAEKWCLFGREFAHSLPLPLTSVHLLTMICRILLKKQESKDEAKRLDRTRFMSRLCFMIKHESESGVSFSSAGVSASSVIAVNNYYPSSLFPRMIETSKNAAKDALPLNRHPHHSSAARTAG
jgi:prolyl-tRNA synthetase